VRDVREEGGDLALAVGFRAAMGEGGVRAAGSAQERPPRVEVTALAPAPGLGLDAVEKCVGDDAAYVRAAATAGSRAGAGLARVAVAVVEARAAVTELAAAVAWRAAAVLRGGRTCGAEER